MCLTFDIMLLRRALEGSLLALVDGLEAVAAVQPAVPPGAKGSFESGEPGARSIVMAKPYCMATALGDLDRHPRLALGLQRRLARLLCGCCRGLVVSRRQYVPSWPAHGCLFACCTASFRLLEEVVKKGAYSLSNLTNSSLASQVSGHQRYQAP